MLPLELLRTTPLRHWRCPASLHSFRAQSDHDTRAALVFRLLRCPSTRYRTTVHARASVTHVARVIFSHEVLDKMLKLKSVRCWQLYFHGCRSRRQARRCKLRVHANKCDAFFWFLLHCSADRAVRSCVAGKQRHGSCSQQCSSDIAHSPTEVNTCVPKLP